MKKSFILVLFLATGLSSCAQADQSTQEGVDADVKSANTANQEVAQPSTDDFGGYFMHTEWEYLDSVGTGIIIQNSFPKGGGHLDSTSMVGYPAPTGTHYGCAVFWTRVINKTAAPLELSMKMPADSFVISAPPDNYFKVFLAPGIMTPDKLSMQNYGIIGLKSFLDTSFHTPSTLQHTIAPNEEYVFYVTVLSHVTGGGVLRAGLTAEEQSLIYQITSGSLNTISIPCGQLTFK